jgi:hypothetical protein
MSINLSQPYRRSLAGPFVLIGVGCLFLMHNLIDFDLFYLIRHYWPLILIMIGLYKLVQYYQVNQQIPK